MVGAYVLDALDPEELSAFERHLAGCAECRVEVGELQSVVDVLPLAVDPVEPPAALRDKVMREAAAEAPDTRPRLRALPGGAPRRAPGDRDRSFLPSWEAVLGVVAAVIILGLAAWNLQLRNQGQDRKTALDHAVAAALAAGALVSPVSGTPAAPGASAAMVQPRHSSTAYFVVRGLPKSRPNRVYQLWLMRGNVPYSVGIFTYSGSDAEIVQLKQSTAGFALTAVTDEPGPHGKPRPTSHPVLLGKLGA